MTAVTETQLDEIYNQVFGKVDGPPNGARSMVEIIHEEAVRCMAADVAVNFENKIVLAIAIRIGAEQFMVKKINDDAFVNGIEHNQTQNLVTKFKTLFGGDTEAIKILDRVVLMTPENIHLNSFMYEPIVDMSDDHLRKLYAAVLALK